jgi:hypothetical protein
MEKEMAALREEAGAVGVQKGPKPKDKVVAEVVEAAPQDTVSKDAVVSDLMARVTLLTQQLAALSTQKETSKPVSDPGTPYVAREDRPHIMVFVTPYDCVRMEVSQEYIDAKEVGWDGTPVKGYIAHENTLRAR